MPLEEPPTTLAFSAEIVHEPLPADAPSFRDMFVGWEIRSWGASFSEDRQLLATYYDTFPAL